MTFRSRNKPYLLLGIMLLHYPQTRCCLFSSWYITSTAVHISEINVYKYNRQECKIKRYWLCSRPRQELLQEKRVVSPLCLPCGPAEQRRVLDASPRLSSHLKHVRAVQSPLKQLGKNEFSGNLCYDSLLWAIIPKSVQNYSLSQKVLDNWLSVDWIYRSQSVPAEEELWFMAFVHTRAQQSLKREHHSTITLVIKENHQPLEQWPHLQCMKSFNVRSVAVKRPRKQRKPEVHLSEAQGREKDRGGVSGQSPPEGGSPSPSAVMPLRSKPVCLWNTVSDTVRTVRDKLRGFSHSAQMSALQVHQKICVNPVNLFLIVFAQPSNYSGIAQDLQLCEIRRMAYGFDIPGVLACNLGTQCSWILLLPSFLEIRIDTINHRKGFD